MNAARQLPRSPSVKPPPLPKSVAPPPPGSGGVVDEAEVTAEEEIPREVLRAARSDVRELGPRPSAVPPRPSAVPRPDVVQKKRSVPPPLPPGVAAVAPAPQPVQPVPEASGPVPTMKAPGPATIPDDSLELQAAAAMKPRPLVFVRRMGFFGAFVAAGVVRAVVAWLAVEWRRARARAEGTILP